jgi:hypothetical protein
MIEAIQCKIDNAGDKDGAATMMTTEGGAELPTAMTAQGRKLVVGISTMKRRKDTV